MFDVLFENICFDGTVLWKLLGPGAGSSTVVVKYVNYRIYPGVANSTLCMHHSITAEIRYL